MRLRIGARAPTGNLRSMACTLPPFPWVHTSLLKPFNLQPLKSCCVLRFLFRSGLTAFGPTCINTYPEPQFTHEQFGPAQREVSLVTQSEQNVTPLPVPGVRLLRAAPIATLYLHFFAELLRYEDAKQYHSKSSQKAMAHQKMTSYHPLLIWNGSDSFNPLSSPQSLSKSVCPIWDPPAGCVSTLPLQRCKLCRGRAHHCRNKQKRRPPHGAQREQMADVRLWSRAPNRAPLRLMGGCVFGRCQARFKQTPDGLCRVCRYTCSALQSSCVTAEA